MNQGKMLLGQLYVRIYKDRSTELARCQTPSESSVDVANLTQSE